MLKLPCGLADFSRLIREDYVYVDRTAHIRDLEELGSFLVFLRPRRFGKSLWLQTLASYYDLRRQDDFDELFGKLAIGHDPTPLANRYFVLTWDFSAVSPRGTVDDVARSLNAYVNTALRRFLSDYRDHLPDVAIREDAGNTFRMVLSAVRQTGHPLYLLIDEYENFVHEVMVRDVDTSRALFKLDHPFKQLFKTVKSATGGQGLERIFITGISPLALDDLTSGFNIAQNVSSNPELATLCGFREAELRKLLERTAADRKLGQDTIEKALDTMRTWYNGYRFAEDETELLYNPTSVLYFLKHLHRYGEPPEELDDATLRTDREKLAVLAHTIAGASVIEQLTKGAGDTVDVYRLKTRFSLDDLTARLEQDPDAVASFLYYMGLLTLTEVPFRLRIPNLVVRKLFLDCLLE